jgi:hypothetical protein
MPDYGSVTESPLKFHTIFFPLGPDDDIESVVSAPGFATERALKILINLGVHTTTCFAPEECDEIRLGILRIKEAIESMENLSVCRIDRQITTTQLAAFLGEVPNWKFCVEGSKGFEAAAKLLSAYDYLLDTLKEERGSRPHDGYPSQMVFMGNMFDKLAAVVSSWRAVCLKKRFNSILRGGDVGNVA